MKHTALTIAAAAMIGLGAANPGWAQHGDKSDETALTVVGLTLLAADALTLDDDRHAVHYRSGRHYDRYDRRYDRHDRRYGRHHNPRHRYYGYGNNIERKLNRCLDRAYRYKRSTYKCYRKAEKRYRKQQHRHYDNRYH